MIADPKKNPVLLSRDRWYVKQKFDRNAVIRISILDSAESTADSEWELSWDISSHNDGRITAHLMNKGTEIVIAGDGSGKIMAGSSMYRMFAGFTALERIEGLDILDTSGVTDMSWLFHRCISLKELDLSGWDVSNVRNFRGTFCCGHDQSGDGKMQKIDLSGWDVSDATDMAYMFYGCGRLKRVDVSGWNTGNVTNFRHTFADCFRLRKISVSGWNTESVITLDGIFNDCRHLKTVDISGWDTSACREFDQMFDNCIRLKNIRGIEKLDTSGGISFEEMFFGCRSIRILDLSSIDTTKADGHEFIAYESSIRSTANMKKMLVGCNRLKRLMPGPDFAFPCQNTSESRILKKMDEVGYVVVSPETGSMMPMLRPKRDHVVFRRKDRYHENDIVLYCSENDSTLIMHRIERRVSEGFMIRGDNAYHSEYVPAGNVFAAATEIYRNSRTIRNGSVRYRAMSWWSIHYNHLKLEYRRSDRIFWKTARKVKRRLLSGNRGDRQ